jgi:hypothetical protein
VELSSYMEARCQKSTRRRKGKCQGTGVRKGKYQGNGGGLGVGLVVGVVVLAWKPDSDWARTTKKFGERLRQGVVLTSFGIGTGKSDWTWGLVLDLMWDKW